MEECDLKAETCHDQMALSFSKLDFPSVVGHVAGWGFALAIIGCSGGNSGDRLSNVVIDCDKQTVRSSVNQQEKELSQGCYELREHKCELRAGTLVKTYDAEALCVYHRNGSLWSVQLLFPREASKAAIARVESIASDFNLPKDALPDLHSAKLNPITLGRQYFRSVPCEGPGNVSFVEFSIVGTAKKDTPSSVHVEVGFDLPVDQSME